MKFKVSDGCIGCGACASICENVFKMDDNNIAVASKEVTKESDLTDAKEAMESCPVEVIHIIKEE